MTARDSIACIAIAMLGGCAAETSVDQATVDRGSSGKQLYPTFIFHGGSANGR